MMKGAAACHLSLQHGLTGGDKVLHLVHGDIGDLQESEGDCRPVHGPPASAGASVHRRPRGPLIGINSRVAMLIDKMFFGPQAVALYIRFSWVVVLPRSMRVLSQVFIW